MKTIETLNALIALDIMAYRALAKTLANNVNTLEAIQVSTDSPKEMMQQFIKEIGRYNAKITVASLVNANDRDGRLSETAKDWAKYGKVGADAYDRECLYKMGIYTKIHLAHLDQIACEFASAEK